MLPQGRDHCTENTHARNRHESSVASGLYGHGLGHPGPGTWWQSSAAKYAFAIASLVLSNLLIHLYCQNWQWLDASRPRTGATAAIGLFEAFILVMVWLFTLELPFPSVVILAPSYIGGMMALGAFAAGLPGLETLFLDSGFDIVLSELELFMLPCVTIGQIVYVLKPKGDCSL